jgi:plasmid stabilization system protein ParE
VSFDLFVRHEAEADLAETYAYYQECRAGLGEDFLLCVEEAFERVLKNPFQYQEVYLDVHRTLVHRFPYCVFYVVSERKVSVIAVMHAARNPEMWKTRGPEAG